MSRKRPQQAVFRLTPVLPALALCLLAGCISLDFTDRSNIEYTRAIAIEVEPPVFRAGDPIEARALVVRPDGSHVAPDGIAEHGPDGRLVCNGAVCFDWSVCLRGELVPGLSGAQFEPEVPTQGCGDSLLTDGSLLTDIIQLQPDGSALIDTAPLTEGIDQVTLAALAAALGIPAETASDVLTRTGLPILLELRVFDGDDVFLAFKRALFIDDGCSEDCRGVNPPAPEFAFVDPADQEQTRKVTGRNALTPFACEACEQEVPGGPCMSTNERIQLTAGRRYIIAPREDGDEWLEPYTVLGLAGDFIEVQEQGYFSFFTNGGDLQEERTRFPAAEEIYTAPSTPGDYALWTVVRDGHYGARACRLEFTATAPD